MKTRLFVLILLIFCFSCGTNNKPLSDAQKEKIKGEVKELVNTLNKGCEQAKNQVLKKVSNQVKHQKNLIRLNYIDNLLVYGKGRLLKTQLVFGK